MSSGPGGIGSSSGCKGCSDVIDFRYHLVSIIAIFFALATGIVLGAGPLDEQVDETLADQIADLRQQNQQLRDQVVALEANTDYQESFIQTVTPQLVGGRLSERDVLLVTMPGADDGMVGTKKVELGPIVDGLRVVRSGLAATDRLVIEGLPRAHPGQKVTAEKGVITAAGR